MTRWWLYRFLPWLTLWLVVAVTFVGLFTETGLRLLWAQVEPRLPPGISVARIEGRLVDEIRVQGLSVTQPGLRLSLEHGSLRWRPLALFSRRLDISSLRLRGLHYGIGQAQPATTEAQADAAFHWPALPTILVREIDLAEIGPLGGPSLLQRGLGQLLIQNQRISFVANEIALRDLPRLRLRLAAVAEGQALQIEKSQLELVAAGQLDFSARMDWREGLTAELEMAAAALDLRSLHPQLPYAIDGGLQLALQPDMRWQLRDLQLKGRWNERPLLLQSASVSGQAASASTDEFLLQLDDARLRVAGGIGTEWKLDARLDLPDLGQLQPGAEGRLQLQARLDGPFDTPRIALKGQARKLQLADWQLSSASIDGTLSRQRGKNSQLELKLAELRGPALHLDQLSLQASGVPSRLQLKSSAAGPQLTWLASAQANIAAQATPELQLGSLELWTPEFDRWRLSQAGPIRVQAQGWQLPRHCLNSEAARLCVAFAGSAAQGQGTFELRDYALSRWPANQVDGLDSRGQLSVAGELQLSNGQLSKARAELETTAISLRAMRDGEELELLGLLPGAGRLRYADAQLEATVDLPGPDASGLQLELLADDQGHIRRGEARLLLRDLEILSLLSPEIVSASGELQARVFVSGRLQSPQIRLDTAVRDGQLFLDTPQLLLERIALRAQGQWPSLAFDGTVHSGKGALQLAGEYQLDTASGQLQIQGRDFLVMDSELARIEVEPDLKLQLTPELLDLRGRLLIPLADIHPVSLGPNSDYVAPTEDEVILGDDGSDKNTALALRSRLRVVLGESVRFNGFGLATAIRGQLRLAVDPGSNPTAEGELSLVDGAYKAYGQSLTIDQGRIIFSGEGLDNPGIDLRASRRPRPEILVGVRARGRVRKPLIELWSEPEMAQTEQLSWLVLGRSGRASSEEDQASLNNAALALGLKGSDFLASRFKGKLGLDDLSIGARPGQDSQQAALVLGKYLNPRLYVSYGIGLFEPIYSFRMRYELSTKWTLQSESGVESGGDILYTIER